MTTKRASKGTRGSKAIEKTTKKSVPEPLWTPVCYAFEEQKPYNLLEFKRCCILDDVYHMWVKSADKPYKKPKAGQHVTLPRTERRFYLDCQQNYTSGQWQYEADVMVPAGSNGMSIMQIHTTDEFIPSTAFMLWWSSANGGSVSHYSKPTLATKLAGKWFHLKVTHDLNTHTVTVWIDHKKVWMKPQKAGSDGAPSFYMKDGVYTQKGASKLMEVYIKNVAFSRHS